MTLKEAIKRMEGLSRDDGAGVDFTVLLGDAVEVLEDFAKSNGIK